MNLLLKKTHPLRHSDHETLDVTILEQPNHNLLAPPTVEDIPTDNTLLTFTNDVLCLHISPNEDALVHSTGVVTDHLTQEQPLFKEDLSHYDFPVTSKDEYP